MTVTNFLVPLLAAIVGGLISGAAVLHQTRSQLRHADDHFRRTELASTRGKRGDLAEEAVATLMQVRDACADLRSVLDRPGFNLSAKAHWDDVGQRVSRIQALGHNLRHARLMSTSFMDEVDGQRLNALASLLGSGADVPLKGQRALEEFADEAMRETGYVESSLRRLTSLAADGQPGSRLET